MKIVIDIPRKTYEHIRADGGHGYFNIYDEDNRIVTKAIFNGTPLPEHHGRLIDADEFHHTLEDMPIRDNDKWFNWLQKACNRLADAPTIIEADKEVE